MPQFPEDPHVGQIVDVSNDQDAPWMTKIEMTVSVDDVAQFYAEAQAISRIPTSARKYLLRGVISPAPIIRGMTVKVNIADRQVMAYQFLEDCGWTPCSLGPPSVRFDRSGTVMQEPILTLTSGTFNVHNEICVDLPPQEEKESKSDEQP